MNPPGTPARWLAFRVAIAVVFSTMAPPASALEASASSSAQEGPVHHVRYEHEGTVSFGILEGDTIHRLEGDFLVSAQRTGDIVALADVKLLAPVVPSKVIAVGLNYRSHLGGREPAEYPGLFAKLPTSIIGPDEEILLPEDAGNVHYEGELVIVIGKEARDVPEERAGEYVFGVTAGNDVSERDWQSADLQWFRAKGADTFGPLGPAVVSGLDYDDLLVQTRLNGEVRQSQSTADLVFGIDAIVAYVSRYVTLLPGDVIFTGTPGSTAAMQAGDVVEVEVQGVGVLRNPVARR